MKRWFLTLALALSVNACAPVDDDASSAPGAAAAPVEQHGEALTATTVGSISLDLGDGGTVLDTGDTSLLGKNKCTPDRQLNCDMCIDNCAYLCDQPNGGGQSGGCIGLFCPTRCDACELSCYKTCGKCTPSQF